VHAGEDSEMKFPHAVLPTCLLTVAMMGVCEPLNAAETGSSQWDITKFIDADLLVPEADVTVIEADLTGDGVKEILFAGVLKLDDPGFYYEIGENVVLIKVLRQLEQGRYSTMFRHLAPHAYYIRPVKVLRMTSDTASQVLISLLPLGALSEMYTNLLITWGGAGVQLTMVESHQGPMQARDIDGDGLDELIHCLLAGRQAPMTERVVWCDVYRWTGKGMVQANEEYPQFYEEQIDSYYKFHLGRAERGETSEYFGQLIRELIERARGILE
jgi:hypothetical protein